MSNPNAVLISDFFLAARETFAVDDYYYRIDPPEIFDQIRDGGFRMRRWSPQISKESIEELGHTYDTLATTEGVYRICFFCRWDRLCARVHGLKAIHPEYVISRIPKHLFASFDAISINSDTGFSPGEAVLIKRIEQICETNQKWSNLLIPFSSMQRLDEGHNWSPFIFNGTINPGDEDRHFYVQ